MHVCPLFCTLQRRVPDGSQPGLLAPDEFQMALNLDIWLRTGPGWLQTWISGSKGNRVARSAAISRTCLDTKWPRPYEPTDRLGESQAEHKPCVVDGNACSIIYYVVVIEEPASRSPKPLGVISSLRYDITCPCVEISPKGTRVRRVAVSRRCQSPARLPQTLSESRVGRPTRFHRLPEACQTLPEPREGFLCGPMQMRPERSHAKP